MDANFIDMVLPIVFSLVGLALIWLFVELALMVRKSRVAIEAIMNDVKPLVKDAGEMAASAKPAIAKIDPLMDRLNLTMDAANLEIMRVDTILEDVGDITNTLSHAAVAVDDIAKAPASAVENVSSRVRDILKGSKAGKTSASLANAKRAAAQQESEEASE